MNTPSIDFIGWDKPAIELVADELFKLREKNPIAFCRSTVVVPTAESGRRLREYMAERATGHALLMPEIILVNKLLADTQGKAATETETQGAWLQVLQHLAETELTPEKLEKNDNPWKPLFPVPPRGNILRWAEDMANQFRVFRGQLEREMVAEAYGAAWKTLALRSQAEEKWQRFFERMGERWEVVQKLFRMVDTVIHDETHKLTQEAARAELLAKPRWKSKRIILACVPEVSPQTRVFLEGLDAAETTISVWVNADKSVEAYFDRFGQPLLTLTSKEMAEKHEEPYWLSSEIHIPHALGKDGTLHLVQDARALGLKAVELASGRTPEQVSVISCDAEMDAALASAFADGADEGAWPVFVPAGRRQSSASFACLPLQLLSAVEGYHRKPIYNEELGGLENNATSAMESYEPLLRNRLMQWCFAAIQGSMDKLSDIREDFIPLHFDFCLDKVRQKLLPDSLRELKRLLGNEFCMSRNADIKSSLYNESYKTYVQWVDNRIAELATPETFAAGAEHLLNALGSLSQLTSAPADLKIQAKKVAENLLEVSEYAAGSKISPQTALTLLQHMVQQETERHVQPLRPKEETYCDIPNWREAAYTRGQRLIITGMHNSVVPERPPGNTFLPETLRCEIGMTSAPSREARDAFLLTALLHSRAEGEVHFIVAHQQADGTPIAPSSLLLRCGANQEELAQRAAYLFGDAPEPAPAKLYETWPLIRSGAKIGEKETIEMLGKSPADNPYASSQKTFSPSDINAFLDCPLRFWLKKLFGLSPDDAFRENKVDLDDTEYGNEMHAVLQQFVETYRSRDCVKQPGPLTDDTICEVQQSMADEMEKLLDSSIRRKFGALLAFPMEAQLDLLKQNLRIFATQHARNLLDGWVNVFCEMSLTPELDLGENEPPARFYMKADRIDYNTNTGMWRIIDYKSNDMDPDTAHIASVEKDAPYIRLMGLEEEMLLTDAKQKKYFRWKNLQLPLYAYGLRCLATRKPTHEKAVRLWEEAEKRCPEILAALTADTMPELCYYNIPKTKVEAKVNTLQLSQKNGKASTGILLTDELTNALRWVKMFCLMMRRGECLNSAESMHLQAKKGDFENLSPTPDPRTMCGLPEIQPNTSSQHV